jgi:uncharacterized protein YeaO (DUF488 family)
MILLKRAYDPAEAADGQRFLVDRLWPRGVKKTALPLDAWLKQLAPGDELRRWYGHQPDRWPAFLSRYKAELDQHDGAFQTLLEAARGGDITLITATRDLEHSNAAALKQFLEEQL